MRPIQIVILIILAVSLFIKGNRLIKVIKTKDKSALKAELLMLFLIVIIGASLFYFLHAKD